MGCYECGIVFKFTLGYKIETPFASFYFCSLECLIRMAQNAPGHLARIDRETRDKVVKEYDR